MNGVFIAHKQGVTGPPKHSITLHHHLCAILFHVELLQAKEEKQRKQQEQIGQQHDFGLEVLVTVFLLLLTVVQAL